MSEIESRLIENRVFFPDSEFAKNAKLSDMSEYLAMCQLSNESYEQFWAQLAREFLIWHSPFTSILNDKNPPFYRWFEDGMLNASYNCIDRHLPEKGNSIALIWEGDDPKDSKKIKLSEVIKIIKEQKEKY